MKKILFILLIAMTLSASAQRGSDGFFSGGGEDYGDRAFDPSMPIVPSGVVGTIPDVNGTNAPLGSGLLILTALGAGYALKKKLKC